MAEQRGMKEHRDSEGFLLAYENWNETLACEIAAEENITLTQPHWEIIHLVRQFYAQFDLAPVNRALVNHVKSELGEEKGNSIYLMQLFPGSPAKLAAKIAGLPKPANCL